MHEDTARINAVSSTLVLHKRSVTLAVIIFIILSFALLNDIYNTPQKKRALGHRQR